MYSGAQIKDIFYTLWDSTQSGTFSNSKLNNIFERAETFYLYKIMNQYGLNLPTEDESTPYLTNFTVVPTGNVLDITETSTELPLFERIIAIAFKFTKGGITYYEYARQLRDEEKISPLKGKVMYPKFDYTNEDIRIYPQTETCLEAKGLYFRTIFGIDVASTTENLPFSSKNVQAIVDYALSIAAQTTRDDGFYNINEREMAQNEL